MLIQNPKSREQNPHKLRQPSTHIKSTIQILSKGDTVETTTKSTYMVTSSFQAAEKMTKVGLWLKINDLNQENHSNLLRR